MPQYPTRRPFTAERRRPSGAVPASAGGDVIAQALRALQAATGPISAVAGDAPPGRPADAGPCCQSAGDLAHLQAELRQLKDSIDNMKVEIAALRNDQAPPAPWDRATSELDAVVQSTEQATHNILEAAERIDGLLAELRDTPQATQPPLLDHLGEQVIRIFEACNFQDITGQRINKVVGAMQFIEVKIERMIDILGGQAALNAVEIAVAEEETDPDAKLLEGPQLEGENKISQNDIDRFFD
jgi:chemotaxis protein CheZ